MIAYRICELKNNNLLTLFHGVNKSRKLPINEWVDAEIKQVKDGSRRKSKLYTSGFHVLPTLEETRVFSNKFTAPRELVIVKCEIGDNYWEKTHSHSNVLLADRIKLLYVAATRSKYGLYMSYSGELTQLFPKKSNTYDFYKGVDL